MGTVNFFASAHERAPLVATRCVHALLLGALLMTGVHAGEPTAPADAPVVALFTAAAPLSPKDLDRAAQRLAEHVRTSYLTVGLEVMTEPVVRIARWLPVVEGRREVAAAHPEVACSLADALAMSGKPDQAESILALLPGEPANDLERADASSAKASIALARQRSDEVRTQVLAAEEALKRAAPEAAYETWRHQLIRRRLDHARGELDAASALATGGPGYWAWLRADRTRSAAAYNQVDHDFPGTLFAEAAAVEAARAQLIAGAPQEALRLLDNPRWRQGPLTAAALVLRGDSLLCSGRRWGEAKAAYEGALQALLHPTPLTTPLSNALRAALLPPRPLHRLDEWSYPTWEARPAGTMLISALDPTVAGYLRYQAVVRLAVVTLVEGDRPAAMILARSLVMFDDIDREMEQLQRGAGGTVLGQLIETGSGVVPLEAFAGVAPDLRARLAMGFAFYQIYDWSQARDWFTSARPRIPASQPAASDAAGTMLACSEEMLGHLPEALAVAATVQLKPGAVPTVAWFKARQLEMDLHLRHPRNYPAAMAAMQVVLDQAPGTPFAQDALRFQATSAEGFDLNLAKKLWLAFRTAYPNDLQSAVAFSLQDIDKRLAAKVTP